MTDKIAKRLSSQKSYDSLLGGIKRLLEESRGRAAQSINAVLTAAYWEIGRRIVEFEQGGRVRAAYGEALIKRLSFDLTRRHGRGFSERNLEQMRLFYLSRPISQTVSAKSDKPMFPLSWSHYVLILSIDDPRAREFYEAEALRAPFSERSRP